MMETPYPINRLHAQLQYQAWTYAERMKELWHTLDEDERAEALGWLKVYEHMLNNWEST